MASVTLATLWLNNVLSMSDYMSFPLMSALSDAPAVGDMMASIDSSVITPIRLYANGNLRAVNPVGSQRMLTATLPACTPTQMIWLVGHKALTLLVRDDRGRRFWAQYFGYTANEHQYDLNTDVSLVLTELTYSDAV